MGGFFGGSPGRWLRAFLPGQGGRAAALEHSCDTPRRPCPETPAEGVVDGWARCFFHAAREGMVITDLAGRIERVNPAFCQITGYSLQEVLGRTPALLASGQHDAAFYRQMWAALQGPAGHWQGEIINRRKNGELYTEWLSISRAPVLAGHPGNYLGIFTDLSPLREAEARARFLAEHDPLTGLPNRRLFEAHLHAALDLASAQDSSLALLFLDIDHFKRINDGWGHLEGDRVLRQVAAVLEESLGGRGLATRQGGDEFLVVTEVGETPDRVLALAEGILARLGQLAGRPTGGPSGSLERSAYTLGGSIGLAFFPGDGGDAESLIRAADEAMYRAKRRGRNNVQVHGRQRLPGEQDHPALEDDLARALNQGELALHYQLQASLTSGGWRAVEALARWHHPVLGWISPERFIPLAEASGLIGRLGEWVLDEACGALARLREELGPNLGLAVNLSAHQLARPGLVETLRATLQRHGLAGRDLELEITESAAMEDLEGSLALFARLRALGVRLAIDDFGTGYASLSYLKRLPIQTLKIDRSFVADLETDTSDGVICQATIALAHGLGLEVVAEGVERSGQLAALKTLGCDCAQGFLLARPLPLSRLRQHLLAQRLDQSWERPSRMA